MTSPVLVMVALLKASVPVTAIVADRIEPEQAKKGAPLPRIVVRQVSGRTVYGLARSTDLRDTRVSVLAAASTFTAADRLAEVVRKALKDIAGAEIGQARVTVRQDGDDAGSAEPDNSAFTRITVYRVIISE